MEIMSAPGSKGQGRSICLVTDVDFMHVGMFTDEEGHSFSCLTLHYSSSPQLLFLEDVALKMRQGQQKPEVYLDKSDTSADIFVSFSLPLSSDVAGLLQALLPSAAYQGLVVGSIGGELIVLAAAEFDFERGPTRFGLKEFLELHQEQGCFYVGLCDEQDPNLSPHLQEFRLEVINQGLPPILSL